MPLKINAKAIARARGLIKARKIDHGTFDESKVARTAANADAFAATDPSADPKTEGHYKFPMIEGGKVNSRAIGNGITRAETSGYPNVAAKLRELSDLIQQHTAMSAPREDELVMLAARLVDLDGTEELATLNAEATEALVLLGETGEEDFMDAADAEAAEYMDETGEEDFMSETGDDDAEDLAVGDLAAEDLAAECHGAAKLLADLEAQDDDPDEFDADDDEEEEEENDDEITGERDDLEPEGDDGMLPPVEERRMSRVDFIPGMAARPEGAKAEFISLRSMDIGARIKPKVDREANAIRNVSVMQAGPAEGHGFVIDKTMLRQVADQMQGHGVPMRFKHPQQRSSDGGMELTDSLGTHVGRVSNVRLDAGGDEIRGDIEFGPHAKKVPMMGDVQGYLMDLADSDPAAFGLSTVFKPADYEVGPGGTPLGRSAGVAACDLTGEPASNRRGLC